MFDLFTSSKRRLERRLIKQCVNVEKPQMAMTMNVIEQNALQRVAKPKAAELVFINTIGGKGGPPGGAKSEALFVINKKRP